MTWHRNASGDEAVMDALTKAAEVGAPCPSNAEISALLGARSAAAAVGALTRLATRGLIRLDWYIRGRRVTIAATGHSTAEVEGPCRKSIFKFDVHAHPDGHQPRVDRDPCTFCGVRGDVGCKHSRAAERRHSFPVPHVSEVAQP